MKIKSACTRLLVSNLEACFLFYRDVMEFNATVEDFQNGYAEFETGDMNIALFRRQEMANIIGNADQQLHTEGKDNIVLIFAVPNLDEAYQQLKHKRVKFTTEPTNNPYCEMKTAYLRDPDGTLIGLFQFLD